MPSSVIRQFWYDPGQREMYVRFVSGELYVYERVPPLLPEAWRAVESKGRFFAARVRGRYGHRRLDPDDEPPPAAEPVWPRPSGPASPPPAGAARSAG